MLAVVLTACGSSPAGMPDGPLADAPRGVDAHADAGADARADAMPSAFDLASAVAIDHAHVRLTFDAAPDAAQAATLASYAIPSLTLSGTPVVSGNTVTLGTLDQSAIAYTVTVSGVTRASDHAALATASAMFTGRTAFDVSGATSPSSISLAVSFDAAPDSTQATTLANYTVAGLTLSGTPVLAGSTVTLATSGQSAATYTITVANVTRASDGEPLTTATATVAGTAVLPPTVTNVVVASTVPNNGAVAYNTGTATLTITGTQFASVSCPTGVALDDLDGAGVLAATHPTSCTVDSDTQITAVFPAGIRTNGAAGWNVIVTNAAASNATSTVPLVPRAGLLVSEVYPGTSGATDHEYVELYNPTATAIDPTPLHLHVRSSTGADTDKALTAVTAALIPSHGFFLIASSASTAADAWFAHEDRTFSAALVGNGGVYASLSGTSDAKVLDKVGWGTQPAHGFEGTALADIPANQSVERKPATGQGHATDTDDNAADFTAASATITPRGTGDAAQPGAGFNVTGAAAASHTSVAVTFDAPPDPTQATTPGNYAIVGLAITSATLAGSTVTLATSAQTAATFTVTVTGVTRALDALPLTANTATFSGRTSFDVASAVSTSASSVAVTFSDPPAGATVLASYAIGGLSISAATLAGSTVTLTTSGQTATQFTLTVTGVTRASDGEALTTSTAMFTGTAGQLPTVTNVVVTATAPDNGTTPYNTGTSTVTITGTGFTTASCPLGVALDDLDGAGAVVATKPASCTIDSDTQITAVLPAGIRTNGATGWNVIVTNSAGSNATSSVPFVPRAGLLISEIYTGTTGSTDHEFLEVYNPTQTTFDPSTLHLHVRGATGTDTNKTLTAVTSAPIPAHGFLLLASSVSAAADAWFTHIDLTYSAALVADGGAYLSLSATANAKVLDKVGWGAQPAPGFEGTAAANIPNNLSSERKPAGGAGNATDTDNNASDIAAPSATLTPQGTMDPAQP